jgi:hypothetical protein
LLEEPWLGFLYYFDQEGNQVHQVKLKKIVNVRYREGRQQSFNIITSVISENKKVIKTKIHVSSQDRCMNCQHRRASHQAEGRYINCVVDDCDCNAFEEQG